MDLQVVDRPVFRFHGVLQPDLDGIHADVIGDHGQERFKSEPGMRTTMTSESTAGRKVGINPETIVFVIRYLVKRSEH